MTDLQQLYPAREEDIKKLEAFINPETGEIIDIEVAQKELQQMQFNDNMKKSIINKLRATLAVQDAIKKEIEHLKQLKALQERRQKSIETFLKHIIEIDGEINLGTIGAKLKKNPPKVVIEDESELADYVKIELIEKKSIDKKKLKEDIKAGKKIKGAKLVQETRISLT